MSLAAEAAQRRPRVRARQPAGGARRRRCRRTERPRRRARRAPRPARLPGRGVHTTRRSGPASTCRRCAPASPSSTSTPDPPIPVPKDELLPHMATFADALHHAWAATPPDIVHAHFWMSGRAALDAGRRLGLPVVQTFHALGVVKRRQQGARDTSPPGRLATEARLARTVDHVIATCTDEVFELVRLGGDRSRIVDRARAASTRLRSRPTAPSSAARLCPAPRRGQPDGRTQGHRQRRHRARRDARHRAGDRRGPDRAAARPTTPRPSGCSDSGRGARRRRARRAARSAPPARTARRCCARPTPSCACRGTSPSASCRSRRWPALGRWSPRAVGGLVDTVVDGVTGVHVPAARRRIGWPRRCATCSADPRRRSAHGPRRASARRGALRVGPCRRRHPGLLPTGWSPRTPACPGGHRMSDERAGPDRRPACCARAARGRRRSDRAVGRSASARSSPPAAACSPSATAAAPPRPPT